MLKCTEFEFGAHWENSAFPDPL